VVGSGAVKKLVESNFPHLPAQQNGFYRTLTFEKKNRENNGSEFRRLKGLKELARYARLGKLKDNSFAEEELFWFILFILICK